MILRLLDSKGVSCPVFVGFHAVHDQGVTKPGSSLTSGVSRRLRQAVSLGQGGLSHFEQKLILVFSSSKGMREGNKSKINKKLL